MRQFILPDLGEGLEEAEIVTWHVNEGDHVVIDQPLVSVETDKAVVEVPSPWSGRIAHLFGAKGDLVKVGAPLVEIAEGGEEDTGTVVGELAGGKQAPPGTGAPAEPTRAPTLQVLPAVRALARKLDVDLNLVQATGPGGTITRADVERAAESLAEAGPRSRSEVCGARWRSVWPRRTPKWLGRLSPTRRTSMIGERATIRLSGSCAPLRLHARPSLRSMFGTMPMRASGE